MSIVSCVCFFFSSRRRHTRCLSDWSSDVCSSDLEGPEEDPGERRDRRTAIREEVVRAMVQGDAHQRGREPSPRSEERRVGKECRARWALNPYKTKETVKQREDDG